MKPHLQKYPHIEVKQNFIQSAFDELPELLERLKKNKPVSPSITKIKDALLSYPLGLTSNPLLKQKPLIHMADSAVCKALAVLQTFAITGFFYDKMYHNIYEMLEIANGYLVKVIEIENIRPNHKGIDLGHVFDFEE
jgi:hypothetical protein